MNENDIFEEVAIDVSERTVGIEEDERKREYQNCLRVMALPGNFIHLWRVFDRVLKLFPNIEYCIGTDLVEVEKDVKTYKLTGEDAIINDVLFASYESARINFYVVFDFKPFLFSTYCSLMEFCNQIIDNFNTKIDLNFRSSSYGYNLYVTNITGEYSGNDIRYLLYSFFKNEMEYLKNDYSLERFTELKWKRIGNMLNDDIFGELEQKIIQHISDHRPSNSATINRVVLKDVMKQQWCKRLETKCDGITVVKKPLNADGDVAMEIKEDVMLEFCKSRELMIDVPSISSTTIIENALCKRGSFFQTEDALVCVMMVHENQKEVVWVYYGWKINMKLPWFIFQTKLELTLRQCFGEGAYKKVYDSLIKDLRNN